MKKLFYLPLILLLLSSCSNEQKQGGLPIIDVDKTYPKKEISKDDILAVEYIPLETGDNVLIDRFRGINCVSENNIVVFNKMQGDIFFFDKKGKLKYKINHKGQSGEEYISIMDVLVDEKKNEMIVIGGFNSNNVLVYDMKGKYKRSFKLNKGMAWKSPFYDFDSNEFIYAQEPNKKIIMKIVGQDEITKPQMKFINKQTGKVDTIIKVPCVEGVDAKIIVTKGKRQFVRARKPAEKFVRTSNGILINDVACDTIFVLDKNKKFIPLLARTPKVSPKDNPLKMVGVNAVTKDAIYLTVMDKKYIEGGSNNYLTKTLYWDKKQKQFFEYTTVKKDNFIGDSWQGNRLVPVDVFKELLEAGKLSGKLKTIAENLKEDDNPVLVKVTLKSISN